MSRNLLENLDKIAESTLFSYCMAGRPHRCGDEVYINDEGVHLSYLIPLSATMDNAPGELSIRVIFKAFDINPHTIGHEGTWSGSTFVTKGSHEIEINLTVSHLNDELKAVVSVDNYVGNEDLKESPSVEAKMNSIAKAMAEVGAEVENKLLAMMKKVAA